MKRGFTLIELLAVIVILAIIALIATPIVLNIINDTKESAIFRSAEYYLDGVEQSIMKKSMDTGGAYKPNVCIVQSNGNLLCDNKDTLVVEIKGEKPTSGEIKFKDGQINKITINLAGKDITKNQYGKFEYVLAPGLYDKNDKLLISWDELVTKYDFKNKMEIGGYDDLIDSSLVGEVINNIKGASKLVIDKSVTSIGDYAFYNCTSLTSITIPEGVTSIGDKAFYECSSLTSITIPESVTSIGNSAFGYCTSLTSIKVDENNSVYDSRDSSNAIIETSSNKLIRGGKNTIIPNSVTSIGDYAFSGCDGLTSITIPEGVRSIRDAAFSGCDSLTSVTIPKGVTSIGNSAFGGCTSLTSITIPESITSIGGYAFGFCISLTSITIPESVTNIGDEAFWECTSLTTIKYKGTASGAPWDAPNATIVTDF